MKFLHVWLIVFFALEIIGSLVTLGRGEPPPPRKLSFIAMDVAINGATLAALIFLWKVA